MGKALKPGAVVAVDCAVLGKRHPAQRTARSVDRRAAPPAAVINRAKCRCSAFLTIRRAPQQAAHRFRSRYHRRRRDARHSRCRHSQTNLAAGIARRGRLQVTGVDRRRRTQPPGIDGSSCVTASSNRAREIEFRARRSWPIVQRPHLSSRARKSSPWVSERRTRQCSPPRCYAPPAHRLSVPEFGRLTLHPPRFPAAAASGQNAPATRRDRLRRPIAVAVAISAGKWRRDAGAERLAPHDIIRRVDDAVQVVVAQHALFGLQLVTRRCRSARAVAVAVEHAIEWRPRGRTARIVGHRIAVRISRIEIRIARVNRRAAGEERVRHRRPAVVGQRPKNGSMARPSADQIAAVVRDRCPFVADQAIAGIDAPEISSRDATGCCRPRSCGRALPDAVLKITCSPAADIGYARVLPVIVLCRTVNDAASYRSCHAAAEPLA